MWANKSKEARLLQVCFNFLLLVSNAFSFRPGRTIYCIYSVFLPPKSIIKSLVKHLVKNYLPPKKRILKNEMQMIVYAFFAGVFCWWFDPMNGLKTIRNRKTNKQKQTRPTYWALEGNWACFTKILIHTPYSANSLALFLVFLSFFTCFRRIFLSFS